MSEENISRNDIEFFVESFDIPLTTRAALLSNVEMLIELRIAQDEIGKAGGRFARIGRHTFRMRSGVWEVTKAVAKLLLFVMTAPGSKVAAVIGMSISISDIIDALKGAYATLSDEELIIYGTILRLAQETEAPPSESDVCAAIDTIAPDDTSRYIHTMVHVKKVLSIGEGGRLVPVV